MTGDASWEVQQAVYAALSADSALQALIGAPARIYDDAPADAAFPFVTIGQARATDWHGADGGVEHDIRLYAWSRYAGRKEVKQIISAVYDIVHEGSFSVAGHRLVNSRFVFADIFRRQDGDTYQGVMRYRIVTEPSA
ncbi:MAG: DUF3168 domain-containing protein [Pseudomonadota bacterium]